MAQNRKIIVLTGASRGLGRAMLEEFLGLGHSVAACARSPLDAPSKDAGQFHFTALDIRDAKAVQAWADEVAKKFGPPDLLLNNAGVINRSAPTWELTPEETDQVVDVNIKGVLNTIRAFVPKMISRNAGVIVNFSSGWGRSTSPDVAPYCASKWAMEGLTQSLAQELPAGMAAVPLNPGIIDTEMLRSCFGGAAGSYPKPADWAKKAVPFLLKLGPSDNGRALTVPNVPID
jgi:NAD(P)-dependent dehydrogenase (short-subunit alcohol dehydrogenase family)